MGSQPYTPSASVGPSATNQQDGDVMEDALKFMSMGISKLGTAAKSASQRLQDAVEHTDVR